MMGAANAVIVAHGQPGAPAEQQAAVMRLAAEVARRMPDGWRIHGATLADPASLVAAQGARLIYPLFMAKGWFTGQELPRRWSEAAAVAGQGHDNLQILPPFGSDPALPALAHVWSCRAARAAGLVPEMTRLLIVGHGSQRGRAAAAATEAFAAQIVKLGGFGRVITAFLEEVPFLAEVARGSGPALCLPFFATAASHVRDDIPAALAEAGFTGPLLPPLGLFPEVPDLIAAALLRAS